jgi:hypothetical protein
MQKQYSFRSPPKMPVRQPQANPQRARPPPVKREKTNADIIEEKMVAMAADPKAVPVYWTDTGPDVTGWDVIFPEFKVLTEAFRGGYGWFDITEGCGRHLLPERQPYKIVHVTKEELKAIRAKEKAEEEALRAEDRAKEREEMALRAKEEEVRQAERRAREAEKERRRHEALQEEMARVAMAEEDSRMKAVLESERRQVQKAKDDAEQVHWAIARILTGIRALPVEYLYSDYLVDYIVDLLSGMEQPTWEAVITGVCSAVEKEQLLFVTPMSSPDLGPICAPADPPPLEKPLPSPAFVAQVAEEYNKILAFIRSPWITFNNVMYMPAVDAVKGYQYIPCDLVLRPPLPPPLPPPSLPPLPPPLPLCDCTDCCPPPLPPCDCTDCCPPPLPPLPPCDCAECCAYPLPVVKARLVTPPQTPISLPSIIIKKLKMPNTNRIKKLLRDGPGPAKQVQKRSEQRNWRDVQTVTTLLAGFQ